MTTLANKVQVKRFKQIEDATCITVSQGLYTPRTLARLGDRVFVKIGAAYRPLQYDQGELSAGAASKRLRVTEITGVGLMYGEKSFSEVRVLKKGKDKIVVGEKEDDDLHVYIKHADFKRLQTLRKSVESEKTALIKKYHDIEDGLNKTIIRLERELKEANDIADRFKKDNRTLGVNADQLVRHVREAINGKKTTIEQEHSDTVYTYTDVRMMLNDLMGTLEGVS